MSRAASLPGANFSRKLTFCLRSHLSQAASLPGAELLPGNHCFLEEATCPGQLRCLGQNFFSKKRTFRKFGTPVRRTRRRKSQKNALSRIMGLLCAEQDVGNLKKTLSGILRLLCAEQGVGNLKNVLSGILGLLCAEQNVGNLKKWTFRTSGTPARRTKRRKSQNMSQHIALWLLFCLQLSAWLRLWL